MNKASEIAMAGRFRGFMPVVVDVETGGFDAHKDALLEVGVVMIRMDAQGYLAPGETHHVHVLPFEGANLNPEALAFTGIDPYHPFRAALPEQQALAKVFQPIRQALRAANCTRAILVGHNAFFDLAFINAAAQRAQIKRNPFHPFSTFDTVSLAGMAYGQTVLARAVQAADMEWDAQQAHSALYDAQQTANLFCLILNQWHDRDVELESMRRARTAP